MNEKSLKEKIIERKKLEYFMEKAKELEPSDSIDNQTSKTLEAEK